MEESFPPLTWRTLAGDVVPMPTSPALVTARRIPEVPDNDEYKLKFPLPSPTPAPSSHLVAPD